MKKLKIKLYTVIITFFVVSFIVFFGGYVFLSNYFIEKLQESNIKYLPYVSGFFICLPCTDAYDICEQLKEQHTYLVPIADDIVRVAICSLNKEEIDELVIVLKNIMK